MAKWYDPFLTKDDSHAQVGQKGIRARKRAKEMGVSLEPSKQVKTTGETTSRASKADTIRQNARQKQNGYSSDSRDTLRKAFNSKKR